jgi:putative transposase
VPTRVSPTDAVRAEIDELFGSGRDIVEVLEEAMRLSSRLVLQRVLEDEVTTWLGRAWNSRSDGERAGQRNGYGDLTVKTTAGLIDLKRPKLRNTTERFASSLLGKGVVRSEPLEALVISAWVRGLSDRDIEALLVEALGPEAALSKSTTSRICQRLREEFEAFRTQDLSTVELDYLFLDGSHFRMHDGFRAEPVLVAYGITTVGAPVLLAVEPSGGESHDAWVGFLVDLTGRGLRPRLLVVSDGAAGLLGALEGPPGWPAAPALSDPSGQKRPGQGPRRAP